MIEIQDAAAAIAGAIAPLATVEEMRLAVVDLLRTAEAQGAVERADAIAVVWNTMEPGLLTLAERGQVAIDLAAAAQEMATMIGRQRDQAVAMSQSVFDEMGRLLEAFANSDTAHPVVASVVADVRSDIEREFQVVSECIGCDIQRWYPELHHDDILIFFDLLYSDALMKCDAGGEELRQRITGFISECATLYQDMKGMVGHEQSA
ncbi:MAG: hypothetical protein L6Q98_23520 [Anaerolineae bacterium]|nr:hypothetical protein [Anaerolineae bacterium]NUQ06376.1 hypothetical protein [Anaerolineae bacterium]